jgi:TatD DNase family protein
MLIDSHAHLNFEEFEKDWQQIIADCQKHNIWMINVGSQFQTSKRAVEIAGKYEKGVYAAVGLHPIHVSGSSFHSESFNIDEYRFLLKNSKKIVAVGETGIDFFHDNKNIENQKKVLLKHIVLAKEFNVPLILHSRNSKDGKQDAYEQILEILKNQRIKESKNQGIRGVIHCFGGNLEQAQEFLKLGFYIGFTGVITFPKTEVLADVIKNAPLEKILVETDCPYLAPNPHRGKRNIPQYVEFVAKKIAEIKEVDYNEIREQTVKNAIKLFLPC